MLQPQPDTWEHVKRMLAGIKNLFDAADFDDTKLPPWASPALVHVYSHVEEALAGVEEHEALVKSGQRCPECGIFVPPSDVFCLNCGVRLVEAENVVAQK